MSIIRQWHGTGSPTGTITSGNLATMVGTGDNAFNLVSGVPAVSATGDQPNRVDISGPAAVTATQFIKMGLGTSLTVLTYSFMWVMDTLPAGGVSPTVTSWYGGAVALQGELDFQLSVRRFRLRNNTAVVASGANNLINMGQLYRVQVQINANAINVKIYDGRTNTVVDTIPGAVTSTVNEIILGPRFAVADMRDCHYDDLMVDNTVTDIPPWIPAVGRTYPAPATVTADVKSYGKWAEYS